MSPVGRLVFKTSEVHRMCLVGSTPTSSATIPGSERKSIVRPGVPSRIPAWSEHLP